MLFMLGAPGLWESCQCLIFSCRKGARHERILGNHSRLQIHSRSRASCKSGAPRPSKAKRLMPAADRQALPGSNVGGRSGE